MPKESIYEKLVSRCEEIANDKTPRSKLMQHVYNYHALDCLCLLRECIETPEDITRLDSILKKINEKERLC